MYLSKDIDNRFTQNRLKFNGFVTYRAIGTRLRNTFSDFNNLKFKVVKFEDLDVNQFSVAGLYDQSTDIKYVILNVSKYSDEMLFDTHVWKDFSFLVSQTIQHETIHQDQFKHREETDEKFDIDFEENLFRNRFRELEKRPDEDGVNGPGFLHFHAMKSDQQQAEILNLYEAYE